MSKYTPRVVWNISDKFDFRVGYRYGVDKQGSDFVYPMISLASDGSYSETLYNCTPSNYFTNAGSAFFDYKTNIARLSNKLTVGWSGNTMVNKIPLGIGANWYTVNGNVADGPTYVPDPKLPFNDYITGPNTWAKYTHEMTYSWQIGDEFTLGDKGAVLVGLNRSSVGEGYYDWETGAPTDGAMYSKSAWTPTASFVYKVRPRLSTYFTYIQALEEGLIVPQSSGSTVYADAGKVFPPIMDHQYEFGAKMNLGGTLLSGALYQISRANTLIHLQRVMASRRSTKNKTDCSGIEELS